MRTSYELRNEAEKTELWGQEVKRIASGDLSVDKFANAAIEKLLAYVNSRVKVYENIRYYLDDDGRAYFATDHRDVSAFDINTNRVSISPTVILSFGVLDGKAVGASYLVLSSDSRDAELTTRRLEAVFNGIKQLGQFLERKDKGSLTSLNDQEVNVKALQKILLDCDAKLKSLDKQFATRHHLHVPGSYVFGVGSFFQSKSQNVVRDLHERLIELQGELTEVLKSHESQAVEYDKFAAQVRLGQ